MNADTIPLLSHPLEQPSAFTPEALIEAVRAERGLPRTSVPKVCLLDFDGDISDWLVASGRAVRCQAWACFHTPMFSLEVDGESYGIIPRTIGGPYAVLVAEQLLTSGTEVILGLTSAGRVCPSLSLPSFVIPTKALRDEGTSYHYLAPRSFVDASSDLVEVLYAAVEPLGRTVAQGAVWTTDAPYRETHEQLSRYAQAGVLAVEMQAASLFAFSAARRLPVGIIAQVTNAVHDTEESFDKGSHADEFRLVQAMCRAGARYLAQCKP
ncbi:MAG TPA: nucleoside phosphorylase [Bryobacteraceae bacterium]|nr:nucleoside phosphorylase [Bryobacteraceae bacterium]